MIFTLTIFLRFLVDISDISRLLLASLAEHAGLSLSEDRISDYVTHIYYMYNTILFTALQ